MAAINIDHSILASSKDKVVMITGMFEQNSPYNFTGKKYMSYIIQGAQMALAQRQSLASTTVGLMFSSVTGTRKVALHSKSAYKPPLRIAMVLVPSHV
jgi:hypothetical protein